MQHKKIIFSSIFALLILTLAIAIPIIIDSQKTATLNLFIIPEQATITINGNTYTNGNYRFNPGAVEITISQDGFETQSFTTELKPNETTLVYKLLNCSDSTLSCYINEENNINFNLIPLVANYLNNKDDILSFYNTTSIKKILPLNYISYSDDYSEAYYVTIQSSDYSNNKMNLVVTDMYGNGKKIADQIITENGYDINDYNITYSTSSFSEIKTRNEQ